MSATSAPFGLRPVYHPSGQINLETLDAGIVSAYGTAIYSGTPVKWDTNGTIIPCTTGADTALGVFAGCQFTYAQRRFVLPYWPAAQTYDAGSMSCQIIMDPQVIYEIQADGPVAITARGEAMNLANTSQGSQYTGQSTQAAAATTTGATPGLMTVEGLAPYPNNEWGDAYTIVRVRLTQQAPVA